MADETKAASGRTVALVAAMEEVFAALDPATREIFVRHRLDGWSYERIARERCTTVADVERQVASAIAALDRGLSRRGL